MSGSGELIDAEGKPTPRFQAYKHYRAEYERRLKDLQRRDREVHRDPFELQRWPMERKVLADRVDQAMKDWEVLGFKSEVEAAIESSAQVRRDQPTGPADGRQANDDEC
jgi:hypothetical protein